jgi:ankyrin repeat protein/Mg-chelatase subunit ChlD
MCPISLDWLVDPVSLPCCGKAISRDSLATWLQNTQNCPLCHNEDKFYNFDVNGVPKLVNLAYMVEQEQAKGNQLSSLFEKDNKVSEWKASINILSSDSLACPTVIGKLQISNNNNKFNFKKLVIAVIDKSGSMGGNPIKQAEYSVNRLVDMTYKHKHLVTNLVAYGDSKQILDINTAYNIAHHQPKISQVLSGGGGTSFSSAFNGIVEVCNKYKDDNEVTSAEIIFLTDGHDSYATTEAARTLLVTSLKNDMAKYWNKKYTVHTVGFGKGYDDKFLNKLSKIGTSEGACKDADPSEDSDILSSKINSIINVIAASSAVPITLLDSNPKVKIISGDNGLYWINLTNCNLGEEYSFNITVNNADPITVVAKFAEDENDKTIWNEWYTHLVDEIASELLSLSTQPIDSLDKQIHCELLEQRSQSILARLSEGDNNLERVEQALLTLKTLMSGGKVDQKKLNDMKSEGLYATGKISTGGKIASKMIDSDDHRNITYISNKHTTWEIVERPRARRCIANVNAPLIFNLIGNFKNSDIQEWLSDSQNNGWEIAKDTNGSNALIVASSVGRCKVVKMILETKKIHVNETNKFGLTALDMAILCGYWYTCETLIAAGALPSNDKRVLFQTCISNKHLNSASVLLKNKFTEITDNMLSNVPTNEGLTWLSQRSQKDITIESAISKGMFDLVSEKLNTVDKILWKDYMTEPAKPGDDHLLFKPSADHLLIIDLLLKSGKADLHEMIDILDDGEPEVTWPLFIACEKGNMKLFTLLLKYTKDDSYLTMQSITGRTLLWIACCNGHIDIALELLTRGASPNIPNSKGNGPLIRCCQRGHDAVVSLLLEAGADLNLYNKERDSTFIISCRTGQAKVLEILFNHIKDDKAEVERILKSYTEIDRLVPLHAATELDKVECIKVCRKYGADLEARTDDKNTIIAGATALHLACHYGRFASVKILCELGSDVQSQTTVDGYTPLHIAVKLGHAHIIRYLLSLPAAKACLEMTDKDGRLPSYYANIVGNESIFEEFFTNKLAIGLGKVLLSDQDMEAKCANILVKYGQSLTCYEHNDVTRIDLGDGQTLLSYALLNGNKHLLTALKEMNANLYKKDDYGVTPAFWLSYLGYDLDGFKASQEVVDMVGKVKAITGSNFQNKLLTKLSIGIPQIDGTNKSPNPLLKMADGYLIPISGDVLTTLKQSQQVTPSLLGFVEKLKNNKVFPDGVKCLDYVTWDAKVHLIKLLASGESVLQPIHMMALYMYTGNLTIFQHANMALSDWDNNSVWHPFVNCLYQGISLLPSFNGEAYRALDTPFDLESYAIGNTLSWNTFSICSQDWKHSADIINARKGIVFIIKSKNGKSIKKYSRSPVDSEIAFLPGTTFRITHHYSPSTIALGQENIRVSSYTASEKELEKAVRGVGAIIVELEELSNEGNSQVLIEEVVSQ